MLGSRELETEDPGPPPPLVSLRVPGLILAEVREQAGIFTLFAPRITPPTLRP